MWLPCFTARRPYLATLQNHGDSVLALFDRLLCWAEEEGGNGCIFLRAAADYVEPGPIRDTALTHKRRMITLIEERLRRSGRADTVASRLAQPLFVLLEGAVAAAFTLGDHSAIAAAKQAATLLLKAEPSIAS